MRSIPEISPGDSTHCTRPKCRRSTNPSVPSSVSSATSMWPMVLRESNQTSCPSSRKCSTSAPLSNLQNQILSAALHRGDSSAHARRAPLPRQPASPRAPKTVAPLSNESRGSGESLALQQAASVPAPPLRLQEVPALAADQLFRHSEAARLRSPKYQRATTQANTLA